MFLYFCFVNAKLYSLSTILKGPFTYKYKGSHPLPNQMFFYTLCKGGGVEPMCKNLSFRFLQFWRPSDNLKLTQKRILDGKIVTNLR